MVVSSLIQKAYLLSAGKAVAPAVDSTKYVKILSLANLMQDMWLNEPDVEWNSTYQWVSIGTVSTTDTYELDETIRSVSKREGDGVRVVHTGTLQESDYELVSPDRFKELFSNNICTVIGRDLIFPKAFTALNAQYEGTIFVPAYVHLDPLVGASDEVLVDDPNWLAYMVAAEYVRNDITKANQYGNLVALAANSMNKMKQNNRGQTQDIQLSEASYGEAW